MNFEQLQYVVAIAETRNLTKASEKLFLSQSALTKSMNRLEYELGIKLFDRLSSPVGLTSAGEYFLTEARKILAQKENLERNLAEYMDLKKGKIHVGIGPSRAEAWLPGILSHFWKLYPNIEVEIVTGGIEFLKQELSERKLDMCVLSLFGKIPSELECSRISSERMLFTVPAGDPILQSHMIPEDSLAEPVVLRPEELEGQHFLTAPRKFGITLQLNQLLQKYHIHMGKVTEVNSGDVAYALSAEGMGISYVAESSAYHPGYYKEPVFCRLEEEMDIMNIVAATRKGEPVPFLVRVFTEILKEAVESGTFRKRQARQ